MHRMTDQNRILNGVLVHEFLHILCHGRVIVSVIVGRVAVVTQILDGGLGFSRTSANA